MYEVVAVTLSITSSFTDDGKIKPNVIMSCNFCNINASVVPLRHATITATMTSDVTVVNALLVSDGTNSVNQSNASTNHLSNLS